MNRISQDAISSEGKFQLKLILSIMIFAILARIAIPPILGHLPNFSPMDAIALFCGAYFYKRTTAFIVTLLSIWFGDLVISKMTLGHWVFFYEGWYWQYASYVLIAIIGMRLNKRIKPLTVTRACLTSSMLFFMISNLGVWYSGFLYPLNLDGLVTCYVAAIPFYKNTLFSDLLFAGLLFGSYELALKKQIAKLMPVKF